MAIGQTAQFVWDYSERSDIFNIHKKGKAIKGSAELGDFTVDFDEEGNIMGIEIMNVSDFLQEAGISKADLSQLQEAEITVTPGRTNLMYIWIKLQLPQNVEKVLSIPAPVMMVVYK